MNMMSYNLRIVLIIFAILLFLMITYILKKGKLPVKYSIFWYICSVVIMLIGIIPDILQKVCKLFGFTTISNLVIGIILTMLMSITLIHTVIISDQKKQIKILIQEVSLMKSNTRK